MIKRLRVLPLPAALVLLTACGGLTSAPTPTADAPPVRDVGSVDACALLERSDFSAEFSKPPAPLTESLSCEWTTSAETVQLKIENRSFEQVRRNERRTDELVLEGRRAWWGVERDGNRSTATVMTELSADRVLTVRAGKEPAGYDIAKVARELAVAALKRLGQAS